MVKLPVVGTTARTHRPLRFEAIIAMIRVWLVQPARDTFFHDVPEPILTRPLCVNSARPSTRSARALELALCAYTAMPPDSCV
jgi:hypothetical protein